MSIYARNLPEHVYETVGRQLEANSSNFGEYATTEIARQVVANLVLLGFDVVPQGQSNGAGLRGKELREAIAAELSPKPEHYRILFARVEEKSTIGGKDPVATFLTQLTRIPGIERVGGQR